MYWWSCILDPIPNRDVYADGVIIGRRWRYCLGSCHGVDTPADPVVPYPTIPSLSSRRVVTWSSTQNNVSSRLPLKVISTGTLHTYSNGWQRVSSSMFPRCLSIKWDPFEGYRYALYSMIILHTNTSKSRDGQGKEWMNEGSYRYEDVAKEGGRTIPQRTRIPIEGVGLESK